MPKKNEYNTTFGNAFAKAFEKSGSIVQPVNKKKPAKVAAPSPAPQAHAKPSHLSHPPKKISANPNLFYVVSKRTLEDIQNDFYSQTASLSKKKGILNGVRAHYYKLSSLGSKATTAERSTLHQLRVLKDEFEKYFDDISKNIIPKVPGAAAIVTELTSAPVDKAPKTIQQIRKLFSTRTQFLNTESFKSEIHVVIGLDFGTSCTKVVIGTPYEQERAFLVPFNVFSHETNRYLLPTHINIEQSHYMLPKTGEKGKFTNLKLKLIKSISSADDENHYGLAIAYLALVFRYVRTWFLEDYKAAFGDRKVTWHTNVGVPSATFENCDITETYRKAVLTAWLVSTSEGDITRNLVNEISESLHCGDKQADQSVTLEVFPEVAAEVAGYARSEHRREGLHLMVDVGAGTLDVCGFQLKRVSGTDNYPLLSSSVNLLGALQLDRCRRGAVIAAVEQCHDKIMADEISPVKGTLDAYFPRIDEIKEKMISSQEHFAKECKTQIRTVAWDLRKTMAKNDPAWANGLPIFLCGGGSVLPIYENLVEEMSSWLKENTTSTGGARSIPLKKPEKLEGNIDGTMFHRFAVAWGLSWPSWDIGTILINLKAADEQHVPITSSLINRRLDYHLDDW